MKTVPEVTITEPECQFRTKTKRWKNGCNIKCLTDEGRKTVTVYDRNYPREKLLLLLCRNCPKYRKVNK